MNLKQKQFQSMCEIVDRLVDQSGNNISKAILNVMCDTGIGCTHPNSSNVPYSNRIMEYSSDAIYTTGMHSNWRCPLEVAVDGYASVLNIRKHILEMFRTNSPFVINNRGINKDTALLAYVAAVFGSIANHLQYASKISNFCHYAPVVSNLTKKVIYQQLAKDTLGSTAPCTTQWWAQKDVANLIRHYCKYAEKEAWLANFIWYQLLLNTDQCNNVEHRAAKAIAQSNGPLYQRFNEIMHERMSVGDANGLGVGFAYLNSAHLDSRPQRSQDSVASITMQESLLQRLADPAEE